MDAYEALRMRDERLWLLASELERLDELVVQAEDARYSKYKEITRLVGKCKHCNNLHYPHCLSTGTT